MTTTTWSFMNKWFTYDTEQGNPSNRVVCPQHAHKLELDPTARPLQDQTPDNNLKCDFCDKEWDK